MTRKVEERVSFIASIYYVVLVNRLERHDFTYTYQFSYESFCLAKPGLRPQWESLYYPLAHQVWAGTVTVLVIVPLVLLVVSVVVFGCVASWLFWWGGCRLWICSVRLCGQCIRSCQRGMVKEISFFFILFPSRIDTASRGTDDNSCTY